MKELCFSREQNISICRPVTQKEKTIFSAEKQNKTHHVYSEFTYTVYIKHIFIVLHPPFFRSAGKLCLVLDLDHTLLHSVMFSELDPKMETWLQSRAEVEAALPQQERRMLFRINEMQMYTKLRPGVREFLRRTAEKFELWIHTNGTSSGKKIKLKI